MKRFYVLLLLIAGAGFFGLWVESKQIADLRSQVLTLSSREQADSSHINSLNKANHVLNRNQQSLRSEQKEMVEVLKLIIKAVSSPESDDASPSKQSYESPETSSSFKVRVVQ